MIPGPLAWGGGRGKGDHGLLTTRLRSELRPGGQDHGLPERRAED
jgi:hypothetical protein